MRWFESTLSALCLIGCGLSLWGCSDGSSGGGALAPTATTTTAPAPAGGGAPPPPPAAGPPAPGAPAAPPPGGGPGPVDDATLLTRLSAAGIATPGLVAPESAELVALGRALFFDKLLSGNRTISCATCHHPRAGSGDDLPLPLGEGASGLGAARSGTTDQVIPRNAPPLWHVAARGANPMFWDGRVSRDPGTGALQTPEAALNGATPARPDMTAQLTTALAAQAMFPVTSPDEMRGDPGDNELADMATNLEVWAGLMARLVGTGDGTVGGISDYRALFLAAYPGIGTFDALTFAHAARALAAYQMSAFAKFDTPLDRYLAGDVTALSEAAKRGAMLFTGPARCDRCHGGPLLSDFRFHAIATPQLGPGKVGGDDLGRALESGDNRDDYAFRTPPLRNVTETAPYFHAGAFPTLQAVLRHYRDPGSSLLGYDPTAELPVFFRGLVDADPTRNQARIAALDPVVRTGLPINGQGQQDLLAFLQGLTDPTAGGVTVPTSVPSGLAVSD